MNSDYFPVHAHSKYSYLDGMCTVEEMVATVARHGQPALALTDHGSMAGTLALYRECMKQGITPFPGSEVYVVTDVTDDDAKVQRYHLGLLALDYEGFKALVALSSRSHTRERFHRKPLIDFADLARLGKEHGEHIAVTTGCYFGLVVQQYVNGYAKDAHRMVKMLSAWFPYTFVEVQNHNVVHDDDTTDEDVAGMLFDIAEADSLPVVLGQDSHYCHSSQQAAHDLMKDICYFGDGEDNRFPGGPYHLASTRWLRKQWTDKQWDRIEEGHAALLDLNRVQLPALDKYSFRMPSLESMPQRKLKNRAEAWCSEQGRDTPGHPYWERIAHELNVIDKMGMASYFLLVARITDFCKEQGIFVEARGSANGSLVCFALGITSVDPIKWKIDFDRFLSLDRKKPPDIDLDIESDRRIDVIDFLRSVFPSMIQIGTYNRIGISDDGDVDDPRGSLIVQYMAAHRRKEGDAFDGKVKPQHWPMLDALCNIDVRKSPGAHAAGFVIPGGELLIEDYLATMLIPSSNTTVTQAVMEDVEDCGYVKIDLLGQRSLSTLRRACEALGKDPVKDGLSWIPDEDKAAAKILRSGKTNNGIFQFEGYATAKGARFMKVQDTHEAILALALFRPAMMDSGMTDRYLEARRVRKPEQLQEGLDWINADTWGVPVFQDQVIQIMRHAGLEYDDFNDVVKAVKASGGKITEYATAIFDRVYPIFIRQACVTLGCTRDEAEDIWATVMQFSDYGFNKAHATGYGLRAHRMAYLKAHHPVEFMAGLLSSWAGEKKEGLYLKEARAMGLTIGRPDVNKSDVLWSIDNAGNLRRGLLSVAGVGESVAYCIVDEREVNGPFTSIEDLIERCPARPVSGGKDYAKTRELKGKLLDLKKAGALTSLGIRV